MKKDDYKSEFEEHRQEIKLDDGSENSSLPSRAELHRKVKKPKKRSRHMIINIILVLFTLVPVIILGFVISSWYAPKENDSVKVENTEVQFETSDKLSPKIDLADKEIDETTPKVEPKPEPKPESKPEPKPEPKPKPKPEPKPEPEPTPEPQSAAKSHKVAPGENLYRISLKYYSSGDGVNKIMRANGLSSNDIVVGQTLVIP